jgi:autotransporter adhesin
MQSTTSAQLNAVGDKAYAGTATVAAVAGIPALATDKKFNIGIGYGNYLNQSAAAIGGHMRLSENMVVKAALGFANSSTTTSVGLGLSF